MTTAPHQQQQQQQHNNNNKQQQQQQQQQQHHHHRHRQQQRIAHQQQHKVTAVATLYCYWQWPNILFFTPIFQSILPHEPLTASLHNCNRFFSTFHVDMAAAAAAAPPPPPPRGSRSAGDGGGGGGGGGGAADASDGTITPLSFLHSMSTARTTLRT